MILESAFELSELLDSSLGANAASYSPARVCRVGDNTSVFENRDRSFRNSVVDVVLAEVFDHSYVMPLSLEYTPNHRNTNRIISLLNSENSTLDADSIDFKGDLLHRSWFFSYFMQ